MEVHSVYYMYSVCIVEPRARMYIVLVYTEVPDLKDVVKYS